MTSDGMDAPAETASMCQSVGVETPLDRKERHHERYYSRDRNTG